MTYEVTMNTDATPDEVDMRIEAAEIVYVPVPVPQDLSHKALRDRDKPKQHPIHAIERLPETLAGKVDVEPNHSLMSDAEHTKLAGIQAGAQVNLIESVKVNGTPLAINGKAVDVSVPTVYATDLQYDQTKGIIKLIGADGSVIGSIDTNLERVIKSGHYDTAKQELVFVTDDGSEIRVPVGDLVDTYTGDGTTITVQDNTFSVAKAVMDQINAKADDAGVVHKAGTEIVTGAKTFTSIPKIRKSLPGLFYTDENIPETGIPTDKTRYANFGIFTGVDETKILSLVRANAFRDGSTDVSFVANSGNTTGYMAVRAQPDGVAYASAPSTPSGSNSTEIVTAGYLNSAPTVVHTTGNETVSGDKTFKNSPTVSTWQGRYYIRSGTVETAVLGNKYDVCEFAMSDSKGNGFAWTRGRINEDLSSEIQLTALNKVGGQNKYASIGIKVGVDGKIIATAPVTPDGANGSEIVTAGWANGKYLPKINGLYESDGTSMWVRVLRLQTASYYTNEISLLRLFRFNNVGTYSTIAELELCNTCSEGGKHPDGGVRAFFKSSMGGFPVSQVHVYYNVDESPGIMEVWVNIQAKKYDYWTAELVDAVSRVSGDRYGEYDMTKVYATSAPAGLKEVEIDYPTAPVWKLGENDNSKHILTIEGANSLPSLVHTTGNQTIAGGKTFADNPVVQNDGIPKISFKTTGYADGDTGGANALAGIAVYDKNFKRYGQLSFVSQDNDRIIGFENFQPGNLANIKKLFFHYQRDGVAYVEAPHRTSGWADSDVVTYGLLKQLGLIKG